MSYITGLPEFAFPERVLSQEEAMRIACQNQAESEKQSRVLKRIYRDSEIDNRYILEESYSYLTGKSNYGETTRDKMEIYEKQSAILSQIAVERFFHRNQFEKSKVTHLVTASCTGFSCPGWDISLIKSTGLSPFIQRTHLGFMGCHAGINAMRVADSICKADPEAMVLVCLTELCSLHFQRNWEASYIRSNALFADASCAFVVQAREEETLPSARLIDSASTIIPDSQDTMGWRIGNHGFMMDLDSKVPNILRDSVQGWILDWLEASGTDFDSIDHWAIHPGGKSILRALQKSLNLTEQQMNGSKTVLREYGNLSSSTVLLVLRELWLEAMAGDSVLMMSFGPGLTGEVYQLSFVRPPVEGSRSDERLNTSLPEASDTVS